MSGTIAWTSTTVGAQAQGTGRGRRWPRWCPGAVAVLLVGIGALAGCGQGGGAGTGQGTAGPAATSAGPTASTPAAPSSPPSTAPSGPATPATPPATATATATGRTATEADRLVAFFATARRADARLRVAASLVNAGIGPSTITIDRKTVLAIQAVDVEAVALAVPAGLPPTVLQPVLQVYAGLVSRQAALRRVLDNQALSPLARHSADGEDLVRCLGNGAAPARWFAGDLDAVRRVATRMAPLTPAAPTSRAAAELALRLHAVRLPNVCADECGGYVPRPVPMPRIVWERIQLEDQFWDGYLSPRVFFTARYVTGHGWQVAFNVC